MIADHPPNPFPPDRAPTSDDSSRKIPMDSTDPKDDAGATPPCESRPACPVCGGRLIEIRAKFHCEQCHRICETCCEGGRG